MTGDALGEPWTGWGWDGSNDWEFESASEDTPQELYALWGAAVARSRDRLAPLLDDPTGMDQLVAAEFASGDRANLRRLIVDLIEEYARHLGQADLIREAVDGRVGEDPPAEWTP